MKGKDLIVRVHVKSYILYYTYLIGSLSFLFGHFLDARVEIREIWFTCLIKAMVNSGKKGYLRSGSNIFKLFLHSSLSDLESDITKNVLIFNFKNVVETLGDSR